MLTERRFPMLISDKGLIASKQNHCLQIKERNGSIKIDKVILYGS